MADDTVPQLRPIVTRAEAKRQGLKHYFTGRPCKWGHVAERDVNCGRCTICRRIWWSEWYRENPVKAKEKRRKLRLAQDPEIRRAQHRAWHAAHPDASKKFNKNKYWRNPEKSRALSAAWKRANPESVRKMAHRRRAQQKISGGDYTEEDISRILRGQNGKCAYCRKSLKKGRHIDHIIAVSKGGANAAANIQLCCPACNIRKSARDPIEFAQSLGRLL